MRVSLNWLKDYVPINLDPEGLANLLTMSGSEVDNIVRTGDELNGIVVSQIVSIAPHPNADKLSLCTVDAGSGTYSIVCGASNIKPGDKAPLALEGTRLPNGITIKTTKIRNQLSQGMLCSETELALGSDKSGIMILPPDMKVGQPLTSSLGLEDSILEISLTPNRPDCLSVTIEDQDLCPRYTARIISGVTVGPSPFWLRKRLESCGMRSINNVVDVTNYLLLEMGQPLHAFDLELLDQKKIVVKRSRLNDL